MLVFTTEGSWEGTLSSRDARFNLLLFISASPCSPYRLCLAALQHPDDPHGCHTYIMYCGIFPSRLNELNFLDSRVNVDVRAFRDNVEYLLKK